MKGKKMHRKLDAINAKLDAILNDLNIGTPELPAEEPCEHWLTLSGTTIKGCGLCQAPASCEGLTSCSDCPKEAQPEPVNPLEWTAGLYDNHKWYMCAGTTTHPTRDITHAGYFIEYHGTHYRCWAAYFDGMTIKHGTLQECLDACQSHERKEQ